MRKEVLDAGGFDLDWEMPASWDLSWAGENPEPESHGWRIFFVEEHCDKFKRICEEVDRIRNAGVTLNAILYIIEPGTFLVPHTGGPNQMILQTGLVCEHGKAVLRVGNEKRQFTNGELMMFE